MAAQCFNEDEELICEYSYGCGTGSRARTGRSRKPEPRASTCWTSRRAN